MELKKIEIRNFKGIKQLDIDFAQITKISGANATGKTTIYDAFLWLLFDKDSTNRKDFAIKPYDKTGNELHNLETMVSGTLIHDSNEIVLTKIFSEKWTKKRGHAEQTFDGHETQYFYNNVPINKNIYVDKINAIVGEAEFKLLTNTRYFCDVMGWEDRRRMLLNLISVRSDLEIASSSKYAELAELLQSYTVDEISDNIKAQIKKMNDELKMLPVRIDEATRSVPALSEEEVEAAKVKIKALEDQIAAIEADMANARKINADYADKIAHKSDLQLQLSEYLRELHNNADKEKVEAAHKISLNLARIKNGREMREQAALGIVRYTHAVDTHQKEIEDFISAFNTVVKDEFVYSDSNICPYCEQQLPKEKIQDKEEKLKEQFDIVKNKKLDELDESGDRAQKELLRSIELLNEAQAQIPTFDALIEKLEKENAELKLIADKELAVVVEDEKCKTLRDAIGAIDPNAPADILSDMMARHKELNAALKENQQILWEVKSAYEVKARISELAAREKELGQFIVDKEKILIMVEEFIMYRCNIVESVINAEFNNVTWKLFNVQINTGVKSCCIPMIQGVPYQDANNASKINAGLEIIDVYSKKLQVSAPIFIDNAESVNELYTTDAQTIALIVTEDKELIIENG